MDGTLTDAGDLPDAATQLVDSVTDHGVTWTFSEPALAGQFITGDYWVVCPVTVTAISPAPANGRNGSVSLAKTGVANCLYFEWTGCAVAGIVISP